MSIPLRHINFHYPTTTTRRNEDLNRDGLIDPSMGEMDPTNPDSDGDGRNDGLEMGLTEPQDPSATDLSAGQFVPATSSDVPTDPVNPDTDNDGYSDGIDNCILHDNADQLDTDGDGYGNLCDGDLNDDGSTNTLDLNLYKQSHRTSVGDANYDVDADFNGDGVINTLDLNIYKGLHRQPPGPSCCAP